MHVSPAVLAWLSDGDPATRRPVGRSFGTSRAARDRTAKPNGSVSRPKAGAPVCSRRRTPTAGGPARSTARSGPRPPTHSCSCTGSACPQAIRRRSPGVDSCGTAPATTTAASTSPRPSGNPRPASPRCSSCWRLPSASTTTASTQQSNGSSANSSTTGDGTAKRSARDRPTGPSTPRSQPSMRCSSTSDPAAGSRSRTRWREVAAFSSAISCIARTAPERL